MSEDFRFNTDEIALMSDLPLRHRRNATRCHHCHD